MPSPAPDLPGTPPPLADATASALPVRNDQADADTSAQRKRPRLDDGDSAHRSLSTEPAATEATPRTPTRPVADKVTVDRTPSRVTINLRPAVLPAASSPGSGEQTFLGTGTQAKLPSAPSMAPSQAERGSPPPSEPVTPSPPCSSPEVEAIDAEEMDGAPPTVWIDGPVPEDYDKEFHTMLLEDFPYLGDCHTLEATLEEIQKHLIKDVGHSASILQCVAEWLERYLAGTSRYESKWYELCDDTRHFWDSIPEFCSVLLAKATVPSWDVPTHDEEGQLLPNVEKHPAVHFLQAYAYLSARMLRIDTRTLQDNADEPSVRPDLLGPPYLTILAKAIRLPYQGVLFQTIDERGYNAVAVTGDVLRAFSSQLETGCGFIVDYAIRLLGRAMLDEEALAACFEFVRAYMGHWTHALSMYESEEGLLAEIQSFPVRFFESVQERLQVLIRKQSSSLRLDSLKLLVPNLSRILRTAMSGLSAPFANRMPAGYDVDSAPLDATSRIPLIEASWKMVTYRDFIRHGHMDARIFGVEGMQTFLQNAYNTYHRRSAAEEPVHPVIQFLTSYIREDKLVQYLLGVDSHHQLVTRSKDIVAFLVVCGQYADAETDTIWNAVRTCQDSHLADAIVELACQIMHYGEISELVYFLGKFTQLATADFDARARLLCSFISKAFINKSKYNSGAAEWQMDLILLLVRLLQELYGEPTLSTPEKQEIRKFASFELAHLLSCNMVGLDRMVVFSDCLNQISQASVKAVGSVSVLEQFIGKYFTTDVRTELSELDAHFNITSLLIKDISRLSMVENEMAISVHDFPELIADRLSLITKILVLLPRAFSDDMLADLWAHVVGSQALSDESRNCAWQYLGIAISQCGPGHRALVDKLEYDYFPTLDESCYTPEIFSFGDCVTEYRFRILRASENDDFAEDKARVGDIMWSIALKTPYKEIVGKAIDTLVRNQLKKATLVPRVSANDAHEGISAHASFVIQGVENVIRLAHESHTSVNASKAADTTAQAHDPKEKEQFRIQMQFRTSLRILIRLVELVRTKTSPSPVLELPEPENHHEFPGQKVKLWYQAHESGKTFDRCSLEIGDLASLQDLKDVFLAKTGFQELEMIAGGAKVDISNQDSTISATSSLTQGLILVHKISGDGGEPITETYSRMSSLEKEIMKHFHPLYDLLDLDIDFELAFALYKFLATFPPHNDVVSMVRNSNTPTSTMFPSKSPLKCAYNVFVLQETLNAYFRQGFQTTDFIAHTIQRVSSAILLLEPLNVQTATSGNILVITVFLECLVRFLKEPVDSAVSASYFEQADLLVDRLVTYLGQMLTFPVNEQTVRVVELCVSALLEGSLHSQDVRQYMMSQPKVSSIFKMLLLESPNLQIREATKLPLAGLLAATSMLEETFSARYYSYFWDCFQAWIPEAAVTQNSTEQFFELAIHVFQNLGDKTSAGLPLADYATQWAHLLCEYNHSEYVGHFEPSYTILGISRLLYWATVPKETQLAGSLSDDTLCTIFANLLFPIEGSRNNSTTGAARTPVLDPAARSSLYSLFLGSTNDISRIRKMVGLCQTLLTVHPDSMAWTWGFAQPERGQSGMDTNRSFESKYAIRSPTGYAGLRNLSNTCYLNSLLTQLFMNPDFRAFMLSIDLSDPRGSESLVYQVKRIFAFLQHTCLRAVDTASLAEVITTYEGTLIDVTVQMDVDEFYNLLFDRIEGQISDPQKKKAFRQLYGGQIVQQIKSKDCPHISERLEPFSAIQCEIQGKSTLEQSLKAYVEGETMEGDNKYSCSSCGAYVNAVKRACLKDVPDNLIFHLKRFDYDLVTGTRNKINDLFRFPSEIDMGPYNVEYLKDTSKPPTPDNFTLVGVLVHSGQAEAGHYYSYIRDTSGMSNTWLEFNDADVSYFDSNSIPTHCFGGLHEAAYNREHSQKAYSAYMLFYQRKSVPAKSSNAAISKDLPLVSSVPFDLANRIQRENDLFLQRYCMFEEEHGKFALGLFNKFAQHRRVSLCSEDHILEREFIHFALAHVEEIFSRQKETPFAVPLLREVQRVAETCVDCARISIHWMTAHVDYLRNILLVSPIENVRLAMADLVVHVLKNLRENDPVSYGISLSGSTDDISETAGTCGTFHVFCAAIAEIQSRMHQLNRVWDDFYGMLLDIAFFGTFEIIVLRSNGILLNSLYALAILGNRNIARTITRLQPLARALERRHFAFQQLVRFAEHLMREPDHASELNSSEEGSSTDKRICQWLPEELSAFNFRTGKGRNAPLAILDAVFQVASGDPALGHRFIITLLNSPVAEDKLQEIGCSIVSGAGIEPPAQTEPWLRGAVALCQHCTDGKLISQVIQVFGKQSEGIYDAGGGSVYLDFFQKVYRAQNVGFMDEQPLFLKTLVLQWVPVFGPALLYNPRAEVRARTLRFLKEILVIHRADDVDESVLPIRREAAFRLNELCVRFVNGLKGARVRVDFRRVEPLQQAMPWLYEQSLSEYEADGEEIELPNEMLVLKDCVEGALRTLEAIASSSPEMNSTASSESEDGYTDYSTQPEN